ncbi:MAG: 50S ribosomal protein L9 [Candidatus Eisenbacteria bacterium]
MEIILLENVDGLGRRGDTVKVARGFARNFLLPRKLGMEATSAGAKMFKEVERVRQVREDRQRIDAEKIAAKLNKVSVHIKVQAGDDGKLFGSVTSADIAEAIVAQGVTVDRKQVQLEEPVRELGVYQVPVKIFQDVEGKVRVLVTKE